jgi:hypothetical protein
LNRASSAGDFLLRQVLGRCPRLEVNYCAFGAEDCLKRNNHGLLSGRRPRRQNGAAVHALQSASRHLCHPCNRADGISEIEGKAARVAASEWGDERVQLRGRPFPLNSSRDCGIRVHSWLTPKNRKNFRLKPVEQITYKLVDVQPAKAVIVNTQKPNAPIKIGFAAP